MNSLLMPFVLFATVIASVGFGVFAAYALVFGILATFGRPARTEAVATATRPRLLLVPTQNHASGD